jgi:hypothetical protein
MRQVEVEKDERGNARLQILNGFFAGGSAGDRPGRTPHSEEVLHEVTVVLDDQDFTVCHSVSLHGFAPRSANV